MTNSSLSQSYLKKARLRLKFLDIAFAEEGWSDVIREAQEILELTLKAMLRQVGVEPPRWHDVSEALLDHRMRFSEDVAPRLEQAAEYSTWLRKERELSFYGDIDFIPTEHYDRAEARRALEAARFVVELAEKVVPPP
jgi:hypothetical protein